MPTDETPSATAAAGDAPAAAAPEPARRGDRARIYGVVALVAIVVALVAIWQEGRHAATALRGEVAQRLATVEANHAVTAKEAARLATELRDAQAKVSLLEARVAESQAEQAALEALYRDLVPSRDDIALTEIEQVLLIAGQQLQLAGNVPAALSALQLADAKLQRLDRPQFVGLKRALARDIDALKATPYVDVAGLAVKLDQAIAAIDSLPLARDERIPAAPAEAAAAGGESSWRRLLRDAWAEVRQLVRIEVSDRPAAPLVPPAQSYFLRENLKLRLVSARLSLVNRHDGSYRADLAAAEDWVRQYYDLRAKPVQALLATLKQVNFGPVAATLPDLSRSVEALRQLRLAQDRALNRPAAK